MSRKKKNFYRISKKSTALFSVRRNKMEYCTIITTEIENSEVQSGNLLGVFPCFSKSSQLFSRASFSSLARLRLRRGRGTVLQGTWRLPASGRGQRNAPHRRSVWRSSLRQSARRKQARPPWQEAGKALACRLSGCILLPLFRDSIRKPCSRQSFCAKRLPP